MSDGNSEKVRTLDQRPAAGSPEEELERAVHEVFLAMRGKDGRAADYDVRRKRVNPFRTVTTKLAKLKRKGVPRAEAKKLSQALDAYIDRKWPEARDEFRRA